MALNQKFPFIPSPYQDEIIGSWLGRIDKLNGSGAWFEILNISGYGKSARFNFFDLIDPDERINNLFQALGISYSTAMLKYSTLPFWKVFRPDLKFFSEYSLSENSFLRKFEKKPNLHSLKVSNVALIARWHCPACIAEDIEQNRMPYWRRLHQLPTSIFCLTHGIPLEKLCSACGASTTPTKARGYELLGLFCKCGADRRTYRIMQHDMPDILKRLAIIGEEALSTENVDWSEKELEMAVRVATHKKPRNVSMLKYLASKMGGTTIQHRFIRIYVSRDMKEYKFRHTHKDFIAAAAFAVENISIKDAIQLSRERRNLNSQLVVTSFTRTNCDKLGVSGARDYIQHKMKNNKIVRNDFAYSYLKIHDPKYLKNMGLSAWEIPSIDEDRETIRNVGLRYSPAENRAYIRDRDWLLNSAIPRVVTIKGKNKTFRRDKLTLFDKRSKLLEAIEKILANETYPEKISYGILGNKVGLSRDQTISVVLGFPSLLQAMKKANDEKRFRLLKWELDKALQCVDISKISFEKICRLAKVKPTAEHKNFLYDYISKKDIFDPNKIVDINFFLA